MKNKQKSWKGKNAAYSLILPLIFGSLWFGVQSSPAQQLPAPFPGWGEWQSAGECGGVGIWVAKTNNDGRNDFEVKLKFQNKTSHRIHARLDANLTSDRGETAQRKANAVINPGRSAEGGALAPSLSFGTVFKAAVNASSPPQIQQIELNNIEIALVDVFPKDASPSTYYRDFGDHPTTKCTTLIVSFTGNAPKYIALTRSCNTDLPKWTPSCDEAVQEIIRAYNNAPADQKECILQWRKYQKCYEVYAFNSNPRPKPDCTPPPICPK
jgi:hypothetical protein